MSYMLKGKATIVLLIVRLIKKTWYKMSEYFEEPVFIRKSEIELNLSNYATK